MPTVQKGTRRVATAALPGARRSAAESAISEGAGVARARADRWQTVGSLGSIAERMGVHAYTEMRESERQRANEVALLSASNKLDQWELQRLHDPEKGALNTRGQAAFELPEAIATEFATVAGDIEKGLGNDEQKLAFAKMRAQREQNVNLNVRRHVAGEIRTYETSELKATVSSSTSLAIANALDPRRVAAELGKAEQAITAAAPRLGIGPEERQALVAETRSNVHVGVIANLLANEQEQAAQIYFDETKGQISGEKLDEITKALDEGSLRKRAQASTEKILAAGGTLTEQRAKAKDIADPKERDEVLQRLEHERNVKDREQRETEEATMKGAYDILDKTHDVAKIPATTWASFTGPVRASMREYAEQRAKGVPIKTNWSTFYGLMQQAGDDPESFSTTNLLTKRHLLDDGDFSRLAELQRQIKNNKRAEADDVLADFRTKEQIVNDSLVQYGVDPKADYDSEEGQAIAQLRRMLDLRVNALQTGTGKKASNPDIQAELDGIMGATVNVPGTWWAMLPWYAGKYDLFDKQKRLVDTKVTDVPEQERAQIEAALRAKGRPVNDTTVLDLYIEAQVRKRK